MSGQSHRFGLAWASAVLASMLTLGCDSSSTPSVGDAGAGPVSGAADMHCSGREPIAVNPASCHPAMVPDAGAEVDAAVEEAAPILFNAEGDDDDCKYHVKFETTQAVTRNGNLTFKVTVTQKANGLPATGAIDAKGNGVAIEAYMASNQSHFAPNPTPATAATETPAGSGVYTIAPIKFDAAGRWVVRFHLYETCSDLFDDSQHGHVAFFFDVP